MDPSLIQQLTGAGVVALVAAVWRLGTQVARQNSNVAQLVKELTEHKIEDRQSFFRIFDRLEKRRGWFRRD
mgnify:CR=1 FL=1